MAQVEVSGVAGLVDVSLQFPDEAVLAISGENGSGKTKLLHCLLSPWLGHLPTERSFMSRNIEVGIVLSADEARRAGVAETVGEDQLAHLRLKYDSMRESSGSNPWRVIGADGEIGSHRVIPRKPVQPDYVGLMPRFVSAERIYRGGNQQPVGPLADRKGSIQLVNERISMWRNSVLDGTVEEGGLELFALQEFFFSLLDGQDSKNPSRWPELRVAIEKIIDPKMLMPPDQENPGILRVRAADGGVHLMSELSSGEKQAVMLTYELFATSYPALTVIDEPDAHLHPSMSGRLLSALRNSLATSHQLIVATHSPGILDSIPVSAITRLSANSSARQLRSETDRIDSYRAAGFRSSALAQSPVLVLVEGKFDRAILPLLSSRVPAAVIEEAGDRRSVLKYVEALKGRGTPIVGVVDLDLGAPHPSPEVSDLIHIWPHADLEGTLLGSVEFREAAFDGKLVRHFKSSGDFGDFLTDKLHGHRERAVAALAKAELRGKIMIPWAKDLHNNPLAALRRLPSASTSLSPEIVEVAMKAGEQIWDSTENKWVLVPGKWLAKDLHPIVLGSVNEFYAAVAVRGVTVPAVSALEGRLKLFTA